MLSIRRFTETWLIFVKQLGLVNTIKIVQSRLLNTLRDQQTFSVEISRHFQGAPPYALLDTDPNQVAGIKKILNALHYAEEGFSRIENISLRSHRKTTGLSLDVAHVSFKNINALYSAIHSFSDSSPNFHAMMDPYLNQLTPKIEQIIEKLQSNVPHHPEKKLMALFHHLPTQDDERQTGFYNVSHLFINLPVYFEQLHDLMTLSPNVPSPQYDAHKKIRQFEAQLEAMASQTGVMLWPKYMLTLKELLTHTSALLNSMDKLTEASYQGVVTILSHVRHTLLPQLIGDLETTEETLGLKNGFITNPLLRAMNVYYHRLTTEMSHRAEQASLLKQADHWGLKAALLLAGDVGVIQIAGKKPLVALPLMENPTFMRTVQHARLERLSTHEANHHQGARTKAAADRFFATLNGYSLFNQAYYQWKIARLPLDIKETLSIDYRFIQPHFAALYPSMDPLICNALSTQQSSLSFTQVMACQKTILTDIGQSNADIQLKIQLINQRIQLQERRQAHDRLTPLFEAITLMPAPPAIQEHQIAIRVQTHLLENAKRDLTEFFELAEALCTALTPTLATFERADKDALLQAYYKIRPFLLKAFLFPEKTSLDHQILTALSPEPDRNNPFTLLQLESLRSTENVLNHLLNRSHALKEQLQNQLDDSLLAIPLTPLTPSIIKRSFFEELRALKLSDKLQHLIDTQLDRFLSSNIDPLILVDLDGSPPSHTNSAQVLLYKKLIEFLHQMVSTLKKTEEFDGTHGNRFTQGTYLFQVAQTVFGDFNRALKGFLNIVNSPGLHVLKNECLVILTPLRRFPMIEALINQSMNADQIESLLSLGHPPVDIVDFWKAQQAIVNSEIVGPGLPPPLVNNPLPEAVLPAAPPVEQPTLLALAEYLYAIPASIERFNQHRAHQRLGGEGELIPLRPEGAEEQRRAIDAFVKNLTGLSYGPMSLKNALQAFEKINAQLFKTAAHSRETIEGHLKEIRSVFSAEIIAVADDTEFNLGLKPGVLSTELCQQFDTIYDFLIVRLKFGSESEKLALLTDTSRTEYRIQKEKDRLNRAILYKKNHELEKARMGNPTEDLRVIHHTNNVLNDYARYCFLNYLDGMKTHLRPIYDRLQPDLEKLEGQYTKNWLNEVEEESAFSTLVIQMQAIAHQHLDGLTQLEQLYSLKSVNWSDPALQTQFLRAYDKIEPYLRYMDKTLSRGWLVIELQTPDDFKSVLKQIIALEPQLRANLEAPKKTHSQKIARCVARVTFLENTLKKEQALSRKKLADLKEAIFSIQFNGSVFDQFERELGPYAGEFLKQIEPDCMKEHRERSKTLPLNEVLENEIINETNAIVQRVKEKHRPLFNATTRLNQSQKMLSAIETQIQQQPEKDPEITRNKQAIIRGLQAIVTSATDPVTRMNTLKNSALSDQTKNALLNNSDGKLVKLLKQFWSWLTGWKSASEKMYSHFSQFFFQDNSAPTEATSAPTSATEPLQTPHHLDNAALTEYGHLQSEALFQ